MLTDMTQIEFFALRVIKCNFLPAFINIEQNFVYWPSLLIICPLNIRPKHSALIIRRSPIVTIHMTLESRIEFANEKPVFELAPHIIQLFS